jgi:ribonucleoside-diphosphate reductase alpha chain
MKKTNKKTKVADPRKAQLFYFKEDEIESKTQLTELRETVFSDRYSLKDENGESLEKHPEQMWHRVAKGIALFEDTPKQQKHWEEKFYQTLKDFKFVPGGRILSGAGTGYEVTFFNCYVIPSPADSRGGIMENITQTVEIQSRAGGVGVNLSSLRPRGARVRKVNGTSSGPVNWAALYSTANHDVIQQGGSRRGALMLMLDDWHPDVLEFIKVKEDLTKIPGANLSVCVSDKFMDAVKNDEEWELIFPDYVNDDRYDDLWDGDIEKWQELGGKVKSYNKVKAREIWKMISEAAWKSAEPGLHFMERSNKRSNTWYFEKLISTNPCGEQPLGKWAVCNLGSMNLVAYVNEQKEFDYGSLAADVQVAMRFMDNVVDANYYFYDENEKRALDIRRTGLGTMGLGDALIKMQVRYGSDKSIEIIEKIYQVIRDNAYIASSKIAAEKGSFPKYDKEKFAQGWFIKNLPQDIQDLIAKNGIRNAVLLTQAPTGTTSLLSGVSSGIEPNFNFEYKRKDRTGEHTILHPLYAEWKKEHPDDARPDYFVSAMDLTPEEHLKVQAKVQEFTDSSISKTVNAPSTYTVEDVDRLYTMAYEMGCKGITFFRDGSRQGVLENIKEEKKEEKKADETNHVNGNGNGHAKIEMPLPLSPESGSYTITRPFVVRGATYKLKTPVGTAFITINQDEFGEPLELFINIGRAGSDVTAMAEALGRTISTGLRFRGSLSPKDRAKEIAQQLSGIGGRRSVGFGPNKILSLPDAVSVALSAHFGLRQVSMMPQMQASTNGVAVATDQVVMPTAQLTLGQQDQVTTVDSFLAAVDEEPQADLCPSCGEHSLVYEEGCAKCYSCGHAEC